jgi:HTH-type transcriptional regulator, cell division transcriptional repressor
VKVTDSIKTGQRVRMFRKRVNMTQEGLARATGISQGEISRIESGRAYLGAGRLQRLCEALSITPGDLT